VSDLNFEQMLAAHHATLKANYDEAEEFSDWMPPDGDGYVVTVIKCSKGVSTKTDPQNPLFWWKPIARIEDVANPDLNGQEFALGFFNSNNPGIMKSQVKALNSGDPVSFEEIDGVFSNSPGKILRVNIKTTKSKKNGQDYTNCFIQEVLATESIADVVAEPPQG